MYCLTGYSYTVRFVLDNFLPLKVSILLELFLGCEHCRPFITFLDLKRSGKLSNLIELLKSVLLVLDILTGMAFVAHCQ
jgi:hypothetical protein